MAIVFLILCTIHLYINTLKRHSQEMWVFFQKQPNLRLRTLLLHYKKMEDPVIHRNYFFLLWIFVTFATDSQGTWTLTYIFFTVINFVMKKESKNLMFFLFFLQKAFSQGSIGNFFYVNFMISEFSYLNITSIGRNLIQVEDDCGYTCLKIPSCFSYNVATFPDVNGKLLCELLPSDKFNNSDKFNASREFHHIYTAVSLLLIYHNSLFLRGNLRATLLDLLLYQVSKVSICKRTTSWIFAGKILKLLTVDSGLKGSFLTLKIYHLPMVRHT